MSQTDAGRRCRAIAVAVAIAAVLVSATTVFVYLRYEAEQRCERWRRDFVVASRNMDQALTTNDRAMVKALGEEFGGVLETEPEGCGRPPRPLTR